VQCLYDFGVHGHTTPAWDWSVLNNTASSSNTDGWVMDSSATSHMVSDHNITSSPTQLSLPPMTPLETVFLHLSPLLVALHYPRPYHTFHLTNVLVVPPIITNLLSLKQFHFTIDNSCSMKNDTFGFSIKDRRAPREIIRCSITDAPL
jgi:hypothetical protein